MKIPWNKSALYSFLLLLGSVGVLALFPVIARLIDLIQDPTPQYLLSVAGERQFRWVWHVHLLVSALADIAAILFGIRAVRQIESLQTQGRWLAIIATILSGFVLLTTGFSLTI